MGPSIPLRMRGAGFLVVEDHLLVSRAEGDPRWGVIGGGLEPGESAYQACEREFREEVALDVRCNHLAIVGDIIIRPQDRLVQDVCFYFVVTAIQQVTSMAAVVSQESGVEVAWLPLTGLGLAPLVPASLGNLIPRALASGGTIYAAYDCRSHPDERAGTYTWA